MVRRELVLRLSQRGGLSSSRWLASTTAHQHHQQPPVVPRESKREDLRNLSSYAAAAPPKKRFSFVPEAWLAVPEKYKFGLGVVATSQALLNFGFGVVVPILPAYAATTLGMGASGVGVVLATPALMRVLLNAPCGKLADKVGRVPMMAAGEGLAAVGVACTGFASGVGEMIAARTLLGAGGAAATAGSAAWTADLTALRTTRPHRGALLGGMSALTSASWVLGPAIGGLLCHQLGPTAMFGGVSAMTAICAASYIFLPEIDKKEGPRSKTSDSASAVDSSSREAEKTSQRTMSELLQCPRQRAAVVANAALSANYAVALSVFPLHCAGVCGYGPLEVGCLFSGMAALGCVGGPVSGWLSDKFGRAYVIAPGLALCALGNVAMSFAVDPVSLTTAAFVLGAGECLAAPAIAAATADEAPAEHRSEALSLSRTASDVVFLTLPPSLGLAADALGCGVPFALIGAASGVAALHVFRRLR